MPRSASITNEVPAFDVVNAVTPVGTAPCAECRGPIAHTYFEADHGVICASCEPGLSAAGATETGSGRWTRGLGFGVAAAVASAALYCVALAVTGRELSVLVLLIGMTVGKAVRLGARARGGRRFQWLAAALTYLAIAGTYVPFVVKGYSSKSAVVASSQTAAPAAGGFLSVVTAPAVVAEPPASLGKTAVGFGGLLLLAIAAPVLEGLNHLLGLCFTIVAMGQAWRMNRRTPAVITGPYRVRAVAAAEAA